jgi:hypothetical protein
LSALAAAVLSTGCGVPARDELVGRYTADGESWSLAADGTCQIARPDAVRRCEWEYVERDGRKTLAVTLLAEPGHATRHRTRLVLTPSRVFGGAVTIPLGGGGELRKVE